MSCFPHPEAGLWRDALPHVPPRAEQCRDLPQSREGGDVSTAFAPAVQATDGAQLVAVLSRDRRRGAAFAPHHAIPAVYDDLTSLLPERVARSRPGGQDGTAVL